MNRLNFHPDARDGGTGRPPDGGAARRVELLADRATQGLSPAEAVELEALGGGDDDGLDRAAAALDAGLAGRLGREAMPADVRARLLAMGEQWAKQVRAGAGTGMDRRVGTGGLRLAAPADGEAARVSGGVKPGTLRFRDRLIMAGSGWGGWFAAAACLGVAALVATRNPRERVIEVPIVREIDAAFKAPVEGFDELMERGEQVVALASVEDDGTEAELVFDPAADKGYLAIAGLDASEDSDLQYQVWLFDAGRDDPHPVNGGLFDVKPVHVGAKIVVPVATRLPVRQPVAFAVTVEPRGGRVVSDGQRVRVKPRMLEMGPPAPADDAGGSSMRDGEGFEAAP